MKSKILNWLIVLVGIVVIANLVRSIYDLWQRDSVIDDARERIAAAEAENASLREKYREVRQKDYIEKEAREKLGMSKEGETVFMLPDNGKTRNSKFEARTEESKKTVKPGWRRWIELFL